MPWIAMKLGANRMSCGRTRRCATWLTCPSLIQARPMEQMLPDEPLAVSKSSAMALAPVTASRLGIWSCACIDLPADQREPVVFAQHRHAMLLGFRQFAAGARTGDQIIR